MLTNRNGFSLVVVLVALVAVIATGVGGYFWVRARQSESVINPIIATVTKGDFVAQVLSDGELQSAENVEIKCEVRARNGMVTVLEAVAEGTRVGPGDFLVSLDSTSFEKELEQQKIAVANAATQRIRSETDFLTAEVSLEEYEMGIYEERKTELAMNLTAAKQDLEVSIENFGYSQQMQAKGFITKQQLDAERLSVEQGKRRIELVEKQLEILEKYSRKKEMIRLESDIQAAKVKMENDEEAYRVELERLEEIQGLIAKCTIRVPAGVSGQVVFNKESSRRGGGTEWVLEPGAEVREGQVLIRLPNPDKMEVKALVQEQSITSVRVGMPAEIRVNALNNQVLKGVVTRVNQYAEQGGWMTSSVRRYAVFVRVLNSPPGLIPGMKAAVSIQTRLDRDRLQVPVQAVYGVQNRYFCLVRQGEQRFQSREVTIDGDNSKTVAISDGLEFGQEVVMNPGEYKHLLDLPDVVFDQPIEMSDEETAWAHQQSAIAAREPQAGVSESQIDELFSQYDLDADGELSEEEIAAMEEPLKSQLSRADRDGDGTVSRTETRQTLEEAHRRMNQGRGPGGPEEVGGRGPGSPEGPGGSGGPRGPGGRGAGGPATSDAGAGSRVGSAVGASSE